MRISDWSSDVCSSDLWSFAALYGAGCIAGLISAWIVARLPEPRLPAPPAKAIGLIERLRSPFRDRNFARLIVFLGTWQFAINFAKIGRASCRERVCQYV